MVHSKPKSKPHKNWNSKMKKDEFQQKQGNEKNQNVQNNKLKETGLCHFYKKARHFKYVSNQSLAE